MRQYYWVLKAIVFAATDMPFFENCRTVVSQYLCMNPAGSIFFSASFLNGYEVVCTAKKNNLRGWLVYIQHQHRTPNVLSDQKNYAN